MLTCCIFFLPLRPEQCSSCLQHSLEGTEAPVIVLLGGEQLPSDRQQRDKEEMVGVGE